MLAEFGPVRAVEMDAAGREMAATRHACVVNGWLPDGLPYPNEQRFARVALLDVLEHVPDDVAGLRRVRDLLPPGGQVVITVPAHQWLWRKQDELNHHFRRYTRAELCRRIEGAGLEVVHASYYNVLLFPIIAGIILGNKWLGRVQDDDNRIPGRWLNAGLEWILTLERYVLPWVSSPLGASVILIARQPMREMVSA